MKNRLGLLGAALVVAMLVSCEKPAKDTMVWGTLSALGTRNEDGELGAVSINGMTLGESGTNMDMVGYCRYQDGKLAFAVGTETPANISTSSDYFFSIDGVEGPPSEENPYDADGLPREDESRSFSSGEIYTGAGAWLFDGEDMIADQCLVVLFAKASSGDLTPLEYGKKRFQYLVSIDCGVGLDNVPSELAPNDRASELRGFNLTLWFNNCES